jgi:GT2 family glycosyltransferase
MPPSSEGDPKVNSDQSGHYRHPDGVFLSRLEGRPLLHTPQGGAVVVDAKMAELWQVAHQHTLAEILARVPSDGQERRSLAAAIGCLEAAGFIRREGAGIPPNKQGEPPPLSSMPQVSVVLVGYNSRAWLEGCLDSLRRQTYPLLEILLVDNGSTDGTAAWAAETQPQVQVTRLENTVSLAAAINTGVRSARGDYFLLLNPDVALERQAIHWLVATAQQNADCGAVAAKLKFSWAPGFINGLGNTAGAFHWGADIGLGHLDLGQLDDLKEVPSVCFAGALVTRQAWESAGPLDEGFPMYYEDIEWSYRARLSGYRVLACPQAVIYHALGQRQHTGKTLDLSQEKLRNVVYGRRRFAGLIQEADYRRRYLRNYLLEDGLKFLLAALRGQWYKVRAYWQAWRDYRHTRANIHTKREILAQQTRLHPGEQFFRLQVSLPDPLIWHGLPELTFDVVENVYLPLLTTGKAKLPQELTGISPQLLIFSNDIVGQKMAGPGIRYWEIARVLARHLAVTLAIPGKSDLEQTEVRLLDYTTLSQAKLQEIVDGQDLVLLSPNMLNRFPLLKRSRTRWILDVYDPFFLENLYYYRAEPLSSQEAIHQQTIELVNRAARLGDFFICGSERQRDLWLGILSANGRVNPATFRQDTTLRQLIDVTGIGLPDDLPQGSFLRGQHPAFPGKARIFLWGGGMWDWLDPLSMVKAWPRIIQSHPEARLVFLGARHPNPEVPRHAMVEQVRQLAAQSGELEQSIFLFDWLNLQEREALLAESDVGLILHPEHIETHFSIRTRVLDYLWAELPVLTSQGDVLSELIAAYGLGRVVPEGDVDAIAQAAIELLEQPKAYWSERVQQVKASFTWEKMCQPLLNYCLHGAPAADRHLFPAAERQTGRARSLYSRLARARYIWRNQGSRALVHRLGRFIQSRLSGSV